jgi:hypothetical protein
LEALALVLGSSGAIGGADADESSESESESDDSSIDDDLDALARQLSELDDS